MKNYFQKILTLFTGHEYPESTRQEFYRWLVDKEHLSEKDEAYEGGCGHAAPDNPPFPVKGPAYLVQD